jgi:lauroyl/myristoyl acyltransferase
MKTVTRNIATMLHPNKKYELYGDSAVLTNGAVLYSLHFGVWELMPRILQKHINKNIGILVNRYTENNPFLLGRMMDKILYKWRLNDHIKIFYPDEIFRIIRFVRDGGVFAALVDGDTLYSKFKKIERLAHLCKVQLIPFAVYQDRETTIMEMGCNLEHLIRQRPNDYWWFYRSRKSSKII